MKVLSLWQPWASLVVHGLKQFETRSWKTNYRGRILIHAAAYRGHQAMPRIVDEHALVPSAIGTTWRELPRGVVLGMVELVDCLPTCQGASWIDELSQQERSRGNFEPWRYGWKLTHPVLFTQPIPWKGGQGLRDASAELISLVAVQLNGTPA